MVNDESANQSYEGKTFSLLDDGLKRLKNDNNCLHDKTQKESMPQEPIDTNSNNLDYHQVLEREEIRAIDSFLEKPQKVKSSKNIVL